MSLHPVRVFPAGGAEWGEARVQRATKPASVGPARPLPPQASRAAAEDPSGHRVPEAVPHAEDPPGLPEGAQGRCHHPGLHPWHAGAEKLSAGG